MLRCIRCAACLTACPTYVIDHKEEEGPRGRIAIMRAIAEGHLDVTEDAWRHVDNCLLCDACSHVCPSGVEMERIGVAFREYVRNGDPERSQGSAGASASSAASWRLRPLRMSLGERFAFRWLFGDLGHFRLLARLLQFYQGSGLRWLARHLGILKVLGLSDMERMLPDMPDQFVKPEGQMVGTGEPAQVFAGCIMSTAFAPTTERTAGLLAAFGCEASYPEGQVCCGALQLHGGDASRARSLALANLGAFGDSDTPIIVNAAGCGAMLKHYSALLPDDARAARFAGRVRDVSEFLATRTPTRAPRPVPLTVTLQDACHLLHAQRISAAPRSLLRAIPELELREMAEPGLCCGSAGVYNVTHEDQAAALQARKCANILASGAPVVLTGNPGCLLQMRAGLPASV
ncbi:MAG TPA: (Fe-S)-binding protein, partial [Chloroflexota bacterium]|nr:(Fe-S)-binding protein [Chloroflexota bacterium]